MSTAAARQFPIGATPETETAEPGPPLILTHHLRLARQHIAQAADSMRELTALIADPSWTEHAAQLSRIAAFVEERYAPMDFGPRSFLTTEQFQRFSVLVQERRDSAHLSRGELAKRAGLSARTIKNIENLLVSPSRETVVRLLELPELNLTWPDILGVPNLPTSGSPGNGSADSEYNCFIPHGYDPVRMVQQLSWTLNGPGGAC